MVTLSVKQYELLQESQELGETDSQRLRNAFLIYDTTRDLIQVIKKMQENG